MKRSKRFALAWLSWFGLLSILPFALWVSAQSSAQPQVDILSLNGIIEPFMAKYIIRGIATAETDGAQAVIIQMDTPGGLMDSMDQIIKKILNSRVPVVVYITPPGARAGSAGVFITMAAHIAAMAPTTNIGAAHPVGGQGEDIQQDLREKVTNDAVARIRALATARGRNADWAEDAVRKSVSVTADQALELHVVDLMANDIDDLLAKLDGRTVSMSGGNVTLHTQGALQKTIGMSWTESILHTISDPNIAYILLSLGTLALIAEFYHPGAILPGLTGVICLVLAFTALGSLEPNWAGVGLIILALILFIVDLKVQSYGLTLGGAITFVVGSILLYQPLTPTFPGLPTMSVSLWLVALMTALWAGFFVFVLRAAVRAQHAPLSSGVSVLVGALGVAHTDLTPHGVVLVRSEEWSAEAVGDAIQKGQAVKVVEVAGGLNLRVVKAPEGVGEAKAK